MKKLHINPPTVERPVANYSQAVRVQAGSLLFVSGQVSKDAQGNVIGKGDIRAQTKQALENLRLVLAEAGVAPDNIVELVTYVVDVEDFLKKAYDVRGSFFKKEPPASTLIEVKRLAEKDILIEIKAIAALD